MNASTPYELMELLLGRLYALPGSGSLLVRGSFVLSLWAPDERNCDDLDLLDTQARPPESLVALFAPLAEPPFTAISHSLIWAESPWPGVRFVLEAGALSLQVDVSQGDPLAAPPVRLALPSGPALWTVAPEMALAWKLHGLFEHLGGNWRAKDLRDIWLLLRHKPPQPVLLREAVDMAFVSREDPPELLRRLLYGDFGRSARSRKGWEQFRAELGDLPCPTLEHLLAEVRAALIPILQIDDDGSLRSNAEVLELRLALLRASKTKEAALKLKSLSRRPRFLPYKAYPATPHLPGSRTGPADKHLPLDKALLLTQKLYDPRDEVIVQEKLDGSCVGAIRIEGRIVALGRDGDLAENSPNPARRLWADWVEAHQQRFLAVLGEGERLMGEWLALAHGTRYDLHHEPFVAFDLIKGPTERLPYDSFTARIAAGGFISPALLHRGGPLDIASAVEKLGKGHHGSVDLPEGAIWRLERAGRVLLLAKYVRPGKADGHLLPENSGAPAVWNWLP